MNDGDPVRKMIRFAAQWLLAPLAVAVAVLMANLDAFRMTGMVSDLLSVGGGGEEGEMPLRSGLTPDQELVLQGDRTRATKLEQQKAIWERWPTNKVYLHHYVTHLLGAVSTLGSTPAERYEALATEVERLRPLDPDNARFDYMLAGQGLEQAVEMTPREVEGPDGSSKTEYDFEVKDREKLDAAMAYFKSGLSRPEFRRYTAEMSVEQLGLLGEPTSLMQQIGQIGRMAGVLLPDLAFLRKLHRTSLFYGELLLGEGRREEADSFLTAYRRMVPQLNDDSFTLIDVLVVGSLARHSAERVPAIYEKLGDAAAAEQARAEIALLDGPVKEWRTKAHGAGAESEARRVMEADVKRHGGVLAALMLPSLGEYPTLEELAPGRQLEYVVAEGFALSLLSVLLVAVMLVSVIAAFYYRYIRGGGAAVVLLLPDVGQVACLLGLGVLVPLFLYFLISRLLPWNGRDLNLFLGWPPFVAQLCLAGLLTLGVTPCLVARFVRRRCGELQVTVPPSESVFWPVFRGCVLVGLIILTVNWRDLFPSDNYPHWTAGFALAALLVVLALAEGIRWIVREVHHGRSCAAYYGSLARTLLPAVALALILVTLVSRPPLQLAERRLLKRDTLMRPDPYGGFTTVESRIVQRLKAEIQAATRSLPPG